MPRFGVSVEKQFSFRGTAQTFGNVYYYEGGLAEEATSSLEALLDGVVANEKLFHSTDVTFLRGRVWSTGQGQAANNMIVDKPLSGTGALTVHSNMDRERTLLVRFRAGSDSRGRPVYLRKWWHVDCAAIAGNAITSAQLKQTAQLDATQRAQGVVNGEAFKQRTVAGTPMNLVSQTGRQITGATITHPYLEHHQLGEEWRGV